MKNALFLTGAAARISQEVAFIDKLVEKEGLQIDSEKMMLAGFSSGALNIAAINACFRSKNPLSWNSYFKQEILFTLTNQQVINSEKKIPLNTAPLRKTISQVLETAEIKTVSDLSFQSFMLTFSYLQFSTLWVTNLNIKHQNINIVDLLMASAAIPILFPDQTITIENEKNRRFSRGRFADGGSRGTFKRFEFYLRRYIWQNGPLNKIYIISPMREISHEDYESLYNMIPQVDLFKMEIKDFKLLRYFLEMISQDGFNSFVKSFYKWTQRNCIANDIYICTPELNENFPLLNFNKQKEQYDAVCLWIDENPEKLAIPLNLYYEKLNHSHENR